MRAAARVTFGGYITKTAIGKARTAIHRKERGRRKSIPLRER